MKAITSLLFLFASLSAVLLLGCGDDDDGNNNNNNQGQQFAPLTSAGVTDPNVIYTINIAGLGTTTLRFPTANTYQAIINGQTVNGTISNLTRNGNSWTATLTPDPNQQGAQGGPLTLTWTGTNAGTFTLQPQGAPAQSGTFTVTGVQNNPGGGGNTNQNPGSTNNPGGGGTVSPLIGKSLQLSYPGGGGEKFIFISATNGSYENGRETLTYQYNTTTGELKLTRVSGPTYDLILPLGTSSGTTTVTYQEPGHNADIGPASFTLQ
jgi:hypothetical protein